MAETDLTNVLVSVSSTVVTWESYSFPFLFPSLPLDYFDVQEL